MSINLLPWRETRAIFHLKIWLLALILFNFTSPIAAYYYNASVKSKIHYKEKKITKLNESTSKLGLLLNPAISEQFKKLKQTLSALHENYIDNESALTQLMRCTIKAYASIKIYKLTLNAEKIRIKGFAKNEASLNHYIYSINKTSLGDIELEQRSIGESLAFDLTATRMSDEKGKL